LLGPFKEEEEGIGVASDAIKVEGEDPATPRLNPWTIMIPQYQFNKTKHHTHFPLGVMGRERE